MFGMHGAEYHNHIMNSISTDRAIIDIYKSTILKEVKFVYVVDYIVKFIPSQTMKIECNPQDKTYTFLSEAIKNVNSIMSIQQAFYELMCEAKLMPINVSFGKYLTGHRLKLEYIIRQESSITTIPDDIDIPLLYCLQYFRVN